MIPESTLATALAQAHISGNSVSIYKFRNNYVIATGMFTMPKEAILIATVDRNGQVNDSVQQRQDDQLTQDGISDIY